MGKRFMLKPRRQLRGRMGSANLRQRVELPVKRVGICGREPGGIELLTARWCWRVGRRALAAQVIAVAKVPGKPTYLFGGGAGKAEPLGGDVNVFVVLSDRGILREAAGGQRTAVVTLGLG